MKREPFQDARTLLRAGQGLTHSPRAGGLSEPLPNQGLRTVTWEHTHSRRHTSGLGAQGCAHARLDPHPHPINTHRWKTATTRVLVETGLALRGLLLSSSPFSSWVAVPGRWGIHPGDWEVSLLQCLAPHPCSTPRLSSLGNKVGPFVVNRPENTTI